MKPRYVVSALMIVGILTPGAVLAAQRPQAQQPGPAVQAIRQSVAGQPAARRALGQLSAEQKNQLRAQVRALIEQSRRNLSSGLHNRRQMLGERLKLRLRIHQTVRRAIRGGR